MNLLITLIVSLVYIFLGISVFFFLTGEFFGAPFVPISKKDLPGIAKKLMLKKGQKIYDLGSGNGRVVRFFAKNYSVQAVGIEINPILVFCSRIISKVEGLQSASFQRKNLFKADFKDADVIFVFLLSKSLPKLAKKILKECKKGTVVVSHGFLIPGMEKKLMSKIDRKIFNTYIYKI